MSDWWASFWTWPHSTDWMHGYIWGAILMFLFVKLTDAVIKAVRF